MLDLLKKLYSPIIVALLFLSISPFASAQQDAMNYFVDGVDAFEDGLYEDAVLSLKLAIDLDSSNLEFQYYLGLSYTALNRYEEALKVFESIVAKEPETFRKVYFEIAAIYSKQEEYQKTVDVLTIAEKIDPNEVRVYLEKGYVYQRLKDYDQSIENFNRVKDLEPKMLQVTYYNIATVHFEAGAFDKANEMFNKAIEVDPETSTAENARQSMRNIKGARRALRPWYLSSSFSWGYDSNVLFKALEQEGVVIGPNLVTDVADQFQTFLLRGGVKFLNRKELEAGAGYSLYTTGYKTLNQNNILGHIPHLYLNYSRHPFYLRVPYDFGYYYTGANEDGNNNFFFLTFGSGSEKKLKMHNIIPTLTIAEPYNLKSEITLGYQNKDYLDEITSDAWNYSGAIVQSYKIPKSQYYPRLGYKYLNEDAKDDVSSFNYHQVLLGISGPIYWEIRGDGSITYERINFVFNPLYATVGERRDNKYVATISLNRPISDMFQLSLAYFYTHNNSNVTRGGIDPFQFKKHVITLTLTGVF
jgi:tetratricopeptide (TPR) repeat protein